MKTICIRRDVTVIEHYFVQVDDDMPPISEIYEDLGDMISDYAQPVSGREHSEEFSLQSESVHPDALEEFKSRIVDLTRCPN